MERAIEAQRHRLLRILAGLLAVVALVSLGPISGGFARMVRAYVSSVLSRAETATQMLVIAQAGALARQHGSDVHPARLFQVRTAQGAGLEVDAVPSLARLQQRLRMLRRRLLDLPQQGLRHLRRAERDAPGMDAGDPITVLSQFSIPAVSTDTAPRGGQAVLASTQRPFAPG